VNRLSPSLITTNQCQEKVEQTLQAQVAEGELKPVERSEWAAPHIKVILR